MNINDSLSLSLIWARWLHASNGERFGQFFCNRYLKDSTSVPGLFNELNHMKAAEVVMGWLVDHHYVDVLPPSSIE